ncbi:retroviral-like aspartic protease family protein [Phenylobacterium sp. LjRoot225]|uniref:aspartyl protease family protein n=1 Tax=Phenylobacterium sp. LjRoot225 TaxID=3342285 RepID=UPI003ED0F820
MRHQLVWPTPQVSFDAGRWSGWIELPGARGLIALPARIGRTRIQAVIDSGAQYSAIDSGLAERLNLPVATPIPMVAFGVSGPPTVTRAVGVDVDLGHFSLKGLRAAPLNLQALSSLTRQPFSLLLGRDFLRAVVVEADFPGRRVAIFAPQAWTPPAGARAVTVRSQTGSLMVEVRIEQAPPVEVMLDTGATGALALSEATARTAGLMDGRPVRRAQSVTLGGVSEDGMTRIRRLTFAGHEIEDIDVQIYRPAANAPAPAGLLGLGVLERFHLALDLPGERVFLMGPERPPRPAAPRPPTRFTL